MPGRHWLDQIERELTRRRLPRQEVARLVAELSEHLDDVLLFDDRARVGPAGSPRGVPHPPEVLKEELMSMEARVAESLGSPVEIADSALREFRRRNLLSRSRMAAFATFVLSPIPLVLVGWIGIFCVLSLIGDLLPESARESRTVTTAEVIGVNAFVLAVLILPPIAAAAFYGRLARRTMHGWWWGLAACLLVGMASGLATYRCTFSDEPGKSQIMIGLCVGSRLELPPLAQVGQFAIPLACGVCVLRRSFARSQAAVGR